VSPTPLVDATLVETGSYGVVRHPMYLSVALILSGYSIAWRSRLAAVGTIVTILFFGLKTRFEEGQLRKAYPRYADYAQRVRWRFIPGLI
ncbi:MAG: methyltransferase family protein, partial [Vicinamibacterales bacterium]